MSLTEEDVVRICREQIRDYLRSELSLGYGYRYNEVGKRVHIVRLVWDFETISEIEIPT